MVFLVRSSEKGRREVGMWTDRYCNSVHVGGQCSTYGEVSCYSNLMESAHAVRGDGKQSLGCIRTGISYPQY
jgi:hypothetical protein